MSPTYKDKIGYLPYKGPLQFSHGGIYPLDSFDNASEYVQKKANEDGFYYPPIVQTYRQSHEIIDGNLETFEHVVPNTKRPAHLFRMPASHEIQIIKPADLNAPRKGDGLFITYLVAFIFGVRLQFHDWWFDGRVPINCQQDFHMSPSATENFIDKAYGIWRNCSDPEKNLLTNLLYMQTKVKSYEWHWERFIVSYMVLDGCYKFFHETHGISSKTHKNRIKTVLEYFDMKLDMEWIGRIVCLRNDLFHETLWEGGQPGNNGSTYSYSAAVHLSKLNSRLIVAILGHRGKYIKSPWWQHGTFMF